MSSKKEIDLSELSDLMASSPAGIDKLKKQAEAIRELQETLVLTFKRKRPYKIPVELDGSTLSFGVISDTHIGSGYQRLDAMKEFYNYCKELGINTILHAGDVVDGWGVYKGQEFELHPYARSWPDQRDMFVREAPKIEGVTTIFITGNHDASFKKLVGLMVGDEIQKLRPDWKYVGADIAKITFATKFGDFSVQLIHPGGGSQQYAVSYKPQKIVEALPGVKPDMMVIGHYHKAFVMPNYRGVMTVCPRCFQSQTPFMATQSLQAHIGGWVFRVVLGNRKSLTTKFKYEFVSFYEE